MFQMVLCGTFRHSRSQWRVFAHVRQPWDMRGAPWIPVFEHDRHGQTGEQQYEEDAHGFRAGLAVEHDGGEIILLGMLPPCGPPPRERRPDEHGQIGDGKPDDDGLQCAEPGEHAGRVTDGEPDIPMIVCGGELSGDAVRYAHPVFEHAGGNPPVGGCRVFRLAGRQRDHARLPVGGRVEDARILGEHDPVPGVPVDKPKRFGADDDRITWLEPVDAAQRLPVPVAMPRNGEIPGLPGHCCVRIVAEPVLVQLVQADALHDGAMPVVAEPGNVEFPDQRTHVRCLSGGGRVAGLRWGDPCGIRFRPVGLLCHLVLMVCGLDARPPLHPCDVAATQDAEQEGELAEREQEAA